MNPEEDKKINTPVTEENTEQKENLPIQPERKPFKTLRTYQGDVDEILSKGKASATTIFVAEEKRRETSPQSFPRQTDSRLRNKIFTTFSITLFFLGVVAIGVVYYITSNEKASLIQKTKTLVSFSKETTIPILNATRAQLIEKISIEKENFKLPPNSVLYLNITNPLGEKADLSSVFNILTPQIPPSLLRSFSNDYMLGIYSFDTNEPFIILKTNDYPNSFSGMLSWEKSIATDLGEVFSIQNLGSDQNAFTDEAIRNKDLRILKDQNKKTILLYSFIDRETLVITTNETIFEAVIGKYLISSQNR